MNRSHPVSSPATATSDGGTAPPEAPLEDPPKDTPRPLWATLIWAALAVLVPLGALASVQWLDDLQRAASTPQVTRPVIAPPALEPASDRQLQPLPPTRPGPTTPDDDASKKENGRD